jgi:serine/threonine-protein kinase
MGEVYRARDLKLRRDVAIKILPELFGVDRDAVKRFQREAQLLASLNHPNIAVIHDLLESDGTHALVLELVEGPTLADRIARGPLAIDEALSIARQMAEALEAAHEQGIIHRDLKPANVKVRVDGTVKVLDFGLAKTFEATPAVVGSLETTVVSDTGTGVVLGTPAYMSPEHSRGQAVDKRSDVWAFGCVLYEMLAGRRPFTGKDVPDVLAAIVRDEPDMGRLPPQTPAGIRRLVVDVWKRTVGNVFRTLESHGSKSRTHRFRRLPQL